MIKLELKELRLLRKNIQEIVNIIDKSELSRELSLSKTKLEEAKMWLGKEIGNVGGEDLNAKRDKEAEKSNTQSPGEYFDDFMKSKNSNSNSDILKLVKEQFLEDVKERGFKKAKERLEEGYDFANKVTNLFKEILK